MSSIKFGISIEPLETIENLEENNSIEKTKENKEFGVRVLEDLRKFLMSFSTTSTDFNGIENIVLPVVALHKWFQRFERRHLMSNSAQN